MNAGNRFRAPSPPTPYLRIPRCLFAPQRAAVGLGWTTGRLASRQRGERTPSRFHNLRVCSVSTPGAPRSTPLRSAHQLDPLGAFSSSGSRGVSAASMPTATPLH
jgi:hypothetical protein